MRNSKYMCSKRIIDKFLGKDCYIYGSGGDGRKFYEKFHGKVFIKAFIDSYDEGELFGVPILNKEVCFTDEVKGRIVIATYRYEEDIARWLEDNGLEAGRDFYIWDLNMYNDTSDEYLIKYIKWNKFAWNKYKGKTDKRRILMAAMDDEGFRSIIYGYLSELLCNKYKAEPEAYISFRFDFKYEGLSDNPYETFGFHRLGELNRTIYKGFGVKTIHEAYPNHTQIVEAQNITEALWSKINSYADWANLYIKGINFGTTIIRCMNRFLLPCFNPKDSRLKLFLERCVENALYWIDQFNEFDYKAVLLRDGVSWDGFIRDIAIKKGIPAVTVHFYGIQKTGLNFAWYGQYKHFKGFWDMLDENEKIDGIEIGEKLLYRHLDVLESTYKIMPDVKSGFGVHHSSERIKIAIFVHAFYEDQYPYGEHIFDNNIFSWLCHLGELSEKTARYEWYIKGNPTAEHSWRDSTILDMITQRYQKIKVLPTRMTPQQIKEFGINYILTVYGDVGSEYPALGIKVITAGDNPFDSFNFTINPKSKDEFDKIIFDLENEQSEIVMKDMYKYWAVNKLYYDWAYFCPNLFESKKFINKINDTICGKISKWDYHMLMDELSPEIHEKNREKICVAWEKAIRYREDFFYKRETKPFDLWDDKLMTISH